MTARLLLAAIATTLAAALYLPAPLTGWSQPDALCLTGLASRELGNVERARDAYERVIA
jgi:hypothetical protein